MNSAARKPAKPGSLAGHLICLEGIDGSGKDTQVTLLQSLLKNRGYQCSVFRFPDYKGPLGRAIRKGLASPKFNRFALQLLFSAERFRQLEALTESHLEGGVVLLSRYKYSSVVYATNRGLPRKWAQALESPLPEPDLTLLLDISVDVSLSRSGQTDCIESDRDLLARCRKDYLRIARSKRTWKKIDASGSKGEVHDAVVEAIFSRRRNRI